MAADIKEEYLDWICSLIEEGTSISSNDYIKLLSGLNDTIFSYSNELDSSRYADGIYLRYRFGYAAEYSNQYIQTHLDKDPCSMLEMMVALALKCDEQVLYNADSRVGKWFWVMVTSLGLLKMTDDKFDVDKFDEIMETFMFGNYEPNGRGGLFAVDDDDVDMRDYDIWYQMMVYIRSMGIE